MTITRLFDEMEIRVILTRVCNAIGGDAIFAQRHGLTESYVTAARKGEATLNDRLLKALGFDSVRRYVQSSRADNPRALAS